MPRAEGFALLAVVAATATLSALVAIVSLSAGQAAAVAAYESHREQARELASAGVEQLVEALAQGRITAPVSGTTAFRDGRDAAGTDVGVGAIPPGQPGWPGRAEYRPGPAYGIAVEMTRVLGPDGSARGVTGPDDGTKLVRVVVNAWFRHGRVEYTYHLVVHHGGAYRLGGPL